MNTILPTRRLLVAADHPRDIAYTHRRALALRNDHPPDVLGVGELADRPHQEGLAILLDVRLHDIVDGLKPNAKPSTEAAKERDAKSVIYHIGPDSPDDRFTPEIEEAVRQFENRLRPKIGMSR